MPLEIPRAGGADTPDDPCPQAPVEPDPADCCGEGCVPCVYDRYEAALERYRAALAAWQTRHPDITG